MCHYYLAWAKPRKKHHGSVALGDPHCHNRRLTTATESMVSCPNYGNSSAELQVLRRELSHLCFNNFGKNKPEKNLCCQLLIALFNLGCLILLTISHLTLFILLLMFWITWKNKMLGLYPIKTLASCITFRGKGHKMSLHLISGCYILKLGFLVF